MVSSYDEHKEELLTRLRRIEGQIRGIQRMIDEGQYCVDILNQISAAVGAAEKVGLIVLQDHIRGCVRGAVLAEDGEGHIRELVDVVGKFVRR